MQKYDTILVFLEQSHYVSARCNKTKYGIEKYAEFSYYHLILFLVKKNVHEKNEIFTFFADVINAAVMAIILNIDVNQTKKHTGLNKHICRERVFVFGKYHCMI